MQFLSKDEVTGGSWTDEDGAEGTDGWKKMEMRAPERKRRARYPHAHPTASSEKRCSSRPEPPSRYTDDRSPPGISPNATDGARSKVSELSEAGKNTHFARILRVHFTSHALRSHLKSLTRELHRRAGVTNIQNLSRGMPPRRASPIAGSVSQRKWERLTLFLPFTAKLLCVPVSHAHL